MDTTTYDVSKLDLAELRELRGLQFLMVDRGGSAEAYDTLTLTELLKLETLYRKMAGLPAREPAPVHVPVIHSWDTPDSSAVTAASNATAVTGKEPAAVAAHNPTAVASTPVNPTHKRRPSDDVMSAARSLDALLRFGA